ncbi:hypothetical protein [Dyadobacter bucti]|uniref:hypothetical protein n=1 Tax=Dyadobacter bucti TaxID=2572203 RepID=UPI001107C532|nr:hypothetical protein [Dyadobacter bucti]
MITGAEDRVPDSWYHERGVGRQNKPENEIGLIGNIIMWAFLLSFIYIVNHPGDVWSYIEGKFQYFIRQLTDKNATFYKICGALIALESGYILYKFKKNKQKYYGLVEIGLSLISCSVTIDKFLQEEHPSILPIIVSSAAAIYFTQRGFSNYFEGVDKIKSKSQPPKEIDRSEQLIH